MRTPISKKLRFEILKRDNFSCRYCGARVPDAQLVVDHLIPIKAGGTDDYFNLVAACFDCNSGKSGRKLDDDSIERQQVQIAEHFAAEVSRHSETAEQYRAAIRQQAINVRALSDMWLYKTGEDLGRAWDAVIDKWLRVFGFGLLADCIQKVAIKGYPAPDILDVARYAAVIFADDERPGMTQCYLMRGRIIKKFSYYTWDFENRQRLLNLLAEAVIERGLAFGVVHKAIDRSETLEQFVEELAGLSVQGSAPMTQPSFSASCRRSSVFVRAGTPEWDAWQSYKHRTTGKGTPMDSQFGWYFPTQFPPEVDRD